MHVAPDVGVSRRDDVRASRLTILWRWIGMAQPVRLRIAACTLCRFRVAGPIWGGNEAEWPELCPFVGHGEFIRAEEAHVGW